MWFPLAECNLLSCSLLGHCMAFLFPEMKFWCFSLCLGQVSFDPCTYFFCDHFFHFFLVQFLPQFHMGIHASCQLDMYWIFQNIGKFIWPRLCEAYIYYVYTRERVAGVELWFNRHKALTLLVKPKWLSLNEWNERPVVCWVITCASAC